jgi:hypothetical protein
MKIVTLVTLFLWPLLASAEHCGGLRAKHWNTAVELDSGSVTLHWTSGYESPDSVCGVSYKTSSGESRMLEVWGSEPVVNKTQSLLALLFCEDDGCRKEILVADIARGVILKAILPTPSPQLYLKAKWNGATRDLLIEVVAVSDAKALPPSHFVCSSAESLRCVKSGI